ncbi:RHS repeat-associated core domain-containing protein, partial [Actinophytocola sp. NPDC049390]|uniref:golvesin C-terminal-like domain-containing protein n=1 Tax=Actinophytocola sp. NPDC049390 TaxID=3363894 RepID=UPI00379EF18A
NNATTLVYDERASLVEARVPHKTGITRTTKFVYDEVGNRTKTITPRGVETTDDPDDFVAETIYDKLNRPKEQLTPFDRDHAEITTPDKTIYTYDEAGRLTEVSMPPSAGQTIRNITRYSYFDNGWQRTSTDPWGIQTSYDYNALGQQTLRTLTSAGGSTDRTMVWDYYPDGKLKSRSDSGAPVGKHEILVDNSDSSRVSFVGPGEDVTVRDTSGTGYHGYDYGRAPAGTFTWNPVVPADGTYEVFVRYPQAANGAQAATYAVDTGTTRTFKGVDQTQGGGAWVSLGRHQLTAGTAAKVELSDDVATGDLLADAVKLVRDNTGVPDNEAKTFSHVYDANANLTTLTDSSPGTPVDTYAMTYNGLNQLTKVEEKLATTIKNTTLFTYNENGAIKTRDHDRQDSVFDYNTRNLLDKVTNTETGGTPKITAFTYTPRGQIDIETKANGNTVDHGYHLDGALASQVEKKTDGTLVAQHLIEYTPNGNRATDHTKIQNADNHAGYLDHIYNYTYDPRERLSQVQKKNPTSGAVIESETYRHDANNNVVDQTVDGTQTQFTYDRNRLVTAASGGATAAYNYDPFGRLDSVISAGQIIEQYIYDGFDRTTTHRKRSSGGSLTSTSYAYDPLDRTTSKTDKAGTPEAKTTDFAYLGLTDKVVAEEIAGQLDRTYQYDAYGRRLTQQKKDTDGSGPEVAEDSYYGYNPHTDVEILTTQAGDTKATYGYTAYGKDDEQAFTGIDKPDTQNPGKEPFNFYRYNGKRFDPASGGYDMGFRDYQPGINRFMTRDMYNGALADFNLATNPWTGNRYAFTGGNPISRIEIDGHCWVWDFVCDGAEAVGEFAVDTADKAVEVASDVGNYVADTFGDAVDFFSEHIDDFGEMALGAATAIGGGFLAIAGGTLAAGGAAACGTGVLCPAGIPAMGVGTAAAATGGGIFLAGAAMVANGFSGLFDNTGGGSGGGMSGEAKLPKNLRVTPERSTHIRSEHGPGARDRNPEKGEFSDDFFYDRNDNDVLDKRVIEAARNGDVRVNDKGPGVISRYDFGPGNEIGWDGERPTSIIEVVIYPDGRIWTAYPTL